MRENLAPSLELRRGLVTFATLLKLKNEYHGYALKRELELEGLALKEGTLYPLLRRLEAQGILNSRWDVTGDRMRKYYVLTSTGTRLLQELEMQWGAISAVIGRLSRTIDESKHQGDLHESL